MIIQEISAQLLLGKLYFILLIIEKTIIGELCTAACSLPPKLAFQEINR